MGLNFHSANGHKNYHDNFNGILANESTFRYLIFRKKKIPTESKYKVSRRRIVYIR